MKRFFSLFLFAPLLTMAQSQAPQPPSALPVFVSYVQEHLKLNDKALQADVAGDIVLEFRVSEFGRVDSFHIVEDIGHDAALDLIRVVKKAGDWKPALVDNKPVAQWVKFPFTVLSTERSADFASPQPVHGTAALEEAFHKNFMYPKAALQAGIQGKYKLQFVITKDGAMRDIVMLNDPGYDIAQHAIRAFKRSGKWKPALSKEGIPIDALAFYEVNLSLRSFRRGVY